MNLPSVDWNTTVFVALGAALAFGIGFGLLFGRRIARADRERAEQATRELDEMREDLATSREEVARHFQETSTLFRDLTDRYTRLYAHLAQGARQFCTDEVPAIADAFDEPLLAASVDPSEQEVPEVRPDPTNGGTPPAAS